MTRKLCGAPHPHPDIEHVVCNLFEGPNAETPAITEPLLDSDGNQVGESTVEPARQVHVHRGLDPADGSSHRWEDPAPEPESGEDVAP